MIRRAKHARRLVRHGQLEGWKALWWVTAPNREAKDRAEALDIESSRPWEWEI